MSTTKRWLSAAALVVGLAAPAAAQDQSSEFDSSRVPGWTFVPGVTFGGIYDSNIGLTTAPADTGRTQGDELMLAAPFGQLEYFGRRTEFSTGYRGFVRRYMDVEQLNSFDQRIYTSLRRLVSRRVTFHLQDSFTDVPSTDEVELHGVPFSRTGAQSNMFSTGVHARLTRFTDLNVRYENTWVSFARTENFLTGGYVNGLRAELSRRLTERTSLGGEYGIRMADLNQGTRELTFHDAGATLHHEMGPHTEFSAATGMSRLDDRLTGETRTGPFVRTGITHKGARATVGASFERLFVPSFGFGGSNQSQEIRGYVQMPLTRNRTYVQGSAAWRRSDPFIESELKLDTVWIRSTLGYALARWFRTELFYAYTRQDSQVTGGEIDRHRAGVQVVVSQPMRIR
ncbi:MAG: hypothetical protein ICV72_11240 [Aldersonia sp.]|nr:hypothetical protein [Aldersonia sp.]